MTLRSLLILLCVAFALGGCGRRPFGLGPEAHQPRLLFVLDVAGDPDPDEFAAALAAAREALPNAESAPVAAVRIHVDVRRPYVYEHNHAAQIRAAGFVPWVRFSDAPTSASPEAWAAAAESFLRPNSIGQGIIEVAPGDPGSPRVPEIMAAVRAWSATARVVMSVPVADTSLQPTSLGEGLVPDVRLVESPATLPVRWPRRAARETVLLSLPDDTSLDVAQSSTLAARLLQHQALGDIAHATLPLDALVSSDGAARTPLHVAQRILQRAAPSDHTLELAPELQGRLAARALLRPPGNADPFRLPFEDWQQSVVLWSRDGIVPVEVLATGGAVTGRVLLVTSGGRVVVLDPPTTGDPARGEWQSPRRVRLDIDEQPVVLFVHAVLGIQPAGDETPSVAPLEVAAGSTAAVPVAGLGEDHAAHWEPEPPVRVARSGSGALSVRPAVDDPTGSWVVPVLVAGSTATPQARLLLPVTITERDDE